MSITIKEIAKLAGVARATVDRALNGREGINPETKALILRIAEENGYQTNIIGKVLAGAKTKKIVGIILNCIDNDFFIDIEKGLENAINEFKKFGFECEYFRLKGYDTTQQLTAIERCINSGIDNIIITPIDNPIITQKLQELGEKGVKIVALNGNTSADKIAYVGCDYFKSGQTAGKLVSILSQGNANLLLVTGSLLLKGHNLRVNGVKTILQNSNVSLIKVIENNDNELTSYENVKKTLIANPSINFVTVTAGGVKGALKAILELGLDIKLTTFDATNFIIENINNGNIMATVTQKPYEQGYMAYKLLCENCIGLRNDKNYCYFTELDIKIKENI